MKNVALCFCSILFGAVLVLWLQNGSFQGVFAATQPPKLRAEAEPGRQRPATKGISFKVGSDDPNSGDALSDIIAPRV
ncbi:MAG: hypothetical protein O2856_06055, partial [Planctomycetota bacterium]|nr:hypothetical protein [Planctomycetota bacterium]